MPIIFVPQLDKKITCKRNELLMDILQKSGVPVASSCLGDGICGKCVLEIKFTKKNNPIGDLELKLKNKNEWNDHQRASCQVKVSSDLEVRSTYW